MKEIITVWAVRWITRQLRQDRGWWESYKANIAMSFVDEYNRSVKFGDTQIDLYGISNRAAENFMKLWTKI